MDCLWIEGGKRLSGSIEVPSSKNASLPLLCLSLLTDKPVRIARLPNVSDIRSMRELLASFGVEEIEPGYFKCNQIKSVRADYNLVRKMRASILCLGPLLARAGRAEVSLPGGCAIGERPVDIHLDALRAMGAKIEIKEGYIYAEAKELRGCELNLKFPTVTGTINLMMAASLAKGKTRIENAAREPEIVEIAEALSLMGAKLEGAGSSTIEIEGQTSLGELNWSAREDRIQLITYLAAAAITRGDIECRPYRKGTIDLALQKFREMGCEVKETDGSVRVSMSGPIQPVRIETAPFPGFPTDAQAQFMACLCTADPSLGYSEIQENVFENRFQHASELRRMGASIKIQGNLASVKGVEHLSGAAVMASDLRASASLVLAGLAAKGKTQVLRVYHLDRGYEGLEKRLEGLGANIRRASQE